jgi:lipoyl(octanoyl) transferase
MSMVEWKTEEKPVAYEAAVAAMEHRVRLIRDGEAEELVWFLEHPPLYTAGTSADPKDLLAQDLPVFATGRGGQYTYHGPGQRVAYVLLDLKRRGADLKRHVYNLEEWLIRALQELGVTGERRQGRVGVWVDDKGKEAKIGAVGVRVRKWVTYHGISLNVSPDLSHYRGIVPCGIRDYGVTSLKELGAGATMGEVDRALRQSWKKVFSPDL